MKINRLLGIVTILSFGSLAGSAARAEERVRVALSVRNVVFLPFYYAKALRIYDKHGLNVELIQMRSDLQLAGLVSGEIDLHAIGGPGGNGHRQLAADQGAGNTLPGTAVFSRQPGGHRQRERVGG